MKKAIIITSSLEVDNSYPLTYSTKRSYFNTEDRLRHTLMTIVSLDLSCGPDTTIYLVDTSNAYEGFEAFLHWQPNLKYISVKKHFPWIHQDVCTHPHKSYCETLIMTTFANQFKKELKEYDYIIKISGRYFIDSKFDTKIFNQTNTDKMFFKHPLAWEWSDSWQYQMVDRRHIDGDNKLRQYCSVVYGFGKEHFQTFLDIWIGTACMLDTPAMRHFDLETLLYHFTRPYKDHIMETDWIVYGWDGASGRFFRY